MVKEFLTLGKSYKWGTDNESSSLVIIHTMQRFYQYYP